MGKHIEDIHASSLLLLHPCRRGAALVSLLAGRGFGYPPKVNQPSSQERGQPGLEQSGKFFHAGCCCVWMWANSDAFWSWTPCWHKQVKFLWQSQRWPWWFLKGVNCSLPLGRMGRSGLITFTSVMILLRTFCVFLYRNQTWVSFNWTVVGTCNPP